MIPDNVKKMIEEGDASEFLVGMELMTAFKIPFGEVMEYLRDLNIKSLTSTNRQQGRINIHPYPHSYYDQITFEFKKYERRSTTTSTTTNAHQYYNSAIQQGIAAAANQQYHQNLNTYQQNLYNNVAIQKEEKLDKSRGIQQILKDAYFGIRGGLFGRKGTSKGE